MLTDQDLINKIKEHIKISHISAQDLTGTGDHWRMSVQSPDFSGKTMVEQHQMIYKALGEWMKKDIHALALETTEG